MLKKMNMMVQGLVLMAIMVSVSGQAWASAITLRNDSRTPVEFQIYQHGAPVANVAVEGSDRTSISHKDIPTTERYTVQATVGHTVTPPLTTSDPNATFSLTQQDGRYVLTADDSAE